LERVQRRSALPAHGAKSPHRGTHAARHQLESGVNSFSWTGRVFQGRSPITAWPRSQAESATSGGAPATEAARPSPQDAKPFPASLRQQRTNFADWRLSLKSRWLNLLFLGGYAPSTLCLPWKRIEQRLRRQSCSAGPPWRSARDASRYDSDGLTPHSAWPPLCAAETHRARAAIPCAARPLPNGAGSAVRARGQWHGLSAERWWNKEACWWWTQPHAFGAGSRSGESAHHRAARGGQQLGDPGGERRRLFNYAPDPSRRFGLPASPATWLRTPVGCIASKYGVSAATTCSS